MKKKSTILVATFIHLTCHYSFLFSCLGSYVMLCSPTTILLEVFSCCHGGFFSFSLLTSACSCQFLVHLGLHYLMDFSIGTNQCPGDFGEGHSHAFIFEVWFIDTRARVVHFVGLKVTQKLSAVPWRFSLSVQHTR